MLYVPLGSIDIKGSCLVLLNGEWAQPFLHACVDESVVPPLKVIRLKLVKQNIHSLRITLRATMLTVTLGLLLLFF